jgi:hypothetical protein
MCRSIKRLRGPEGVAPDDEIREASLQYVRKVSGFRAPSRRNEAMARSALRHVVRWVSSAPAIISNGSRAGHHPCGP